LKERVYVSPLFYFFIAFNFNLFFTFMDFNKIIRFKIGSENWEMPLGVMLMVGGITLVLMIGGAYLGFRFGQSLH
jgi:hypothetical protein